MQKENHRSGQCWCMAPPSCPLTIGDVNLERYLFPPPLFFCPFHVHTILWSLWLASDAEGHYPQDKKKSRTDTRRASFSLISLYICALWSDHTLNIYLDVVVDWLVPRTLPAPTQSTRFDGSSPTGTCQRKKKKRKITNGFFFFFFSVSVSWLFMCSFARPLPLSVSPLRVSIPLLIFYKKKEFQGKNFHIISLGYFFFYVRFLSVLPFYNRSLRLSWLRRCCCVY